MFPQGPLAWENVKIGHGFIAKSVDRAHLVKYDLLGNGPLAFVNKLCALVDEKKDELPPDEWDSLQFTLKALMVRYEDGELYEHLLHTFGPDNLNYNAWVHFSIDPVWDVCLKVFTEMPTEVLEEYGSRNWVPYQHDVDNEAIMESISKRTDIYGGNNIPQDLLEGILFNINKS
jgi:hypothetical protein